MTEIGPRVYRGFRWVSGLGLIRLRAKGFRAWGWKLRVVSNWVRGSALSRWDASNVSLTLLPNWRLSSLPRHCLAVLLVLAFVPLLVVTVISYQGG